MSLENKKVGDTVYLHYSNRRDSHLGGEFFITKIGRKYISLAREKDSEYVDFQVNKSPHNHFYHLTVQTYGGSSSVFPDKQAYQDYLVVSKIERKLGDMFKYGNNSYTLEQMLKVTEILNIRWEEK